MRVAAIGNMGIAMWSLLDIHFNFMGSLSLVHVLESGTPPVSFFMEKSSTETMWDVYYIMTGLAHGHCCL